MTTDAAKPGRRRLAAMALIAPLALAGCSSPGKSGPATSPTRVSQTGPLVAPSTTAVQNADYLKKLSLADNDLAVYMTDKGNDGFKSLLTAGSAFCAFLSRYRDLDTAMVSLVQGVRGAQVASDLPQNVETYNAIDAVALLTLCPDEQKLVPAATQAKIRSLGVTLAGHNPSAPPPGG